MSCESAEMLVLLRGLHKNIASSYAVLKGPEIGAALSGLQSMTGGYSELRSLVYVLVMKIRPNEIPLSAESIGDALYGLQLMHVGEVPELVAVLDVLTRQIEDSAAVLDGRNLARALFGLQNWRYEEAGVPRVLNSLLAKVDSKALSMDGEDLLMCLTGVQHMSAQHPEVQLILQIVHEQMKNVKLTLAQISRAQNIFESKSNLGVMQDIRSLLDSMKGRAE